MRTKQKERSMAYCMKLLNKNHEKLLEVKEYSKLIYQSYQLGG